MESQTLTHNGGPPQALQQISSGLEGLAVAIDSLPDVFDGLDEVRKTVERLHELQQRRLELLAPDTVPLRPALRLLPQRGDEAEEEPDGQFEGDEPPTEEDMSIDDTEYEGGNSPEIRPRRDRFDTWVDHDDLTEASREELRTHDGQFVPCCKVRLLSLSFQDGLLQTEAANEVVRTILKNGSGKEVAPKEILSTIEAERAFRRELTALLSEALIDPKPPFADQRKALGEVRFSLDAKYEPKIEWKHLETIYEQVKESRPDLVELRSRWEGVAHEVAHANIGLARSYTEANWGWLLQGATHEHYGIAYVGLHKGVCRFEVERGFQLSTYANWWMRSVVSREITTSFGLIDVPEHLHRASRQLRKAERLLQDEEKSPENIARVLEISKDDAAKLIEAGIAVRRSRVSTGKVDLTEGETDLSYSLSTYADPSAKTVEDEAGSAEVIERVRDALEQLAVEDPRYALVLRLRFGIDGEPQTLEAIGEVLGVSRERVRQLQSSAMSRLSAYEMVRGAEYDVVESEGAFERVQEIAQARSAGEDLSLEEISRVNRFLDSRQGREGLPPVRGRIQDDSPTLRRWGIRSLAVSLSEVSAELPEPPPDISTTEFKTKKALVLNYLREFIESDSPSQVVPTYRAIGETLGVSVFVVKDAISSLEPHERKLFLALKKSLTVDPEKDRMKIRIGRVGEITKEAEAILLEHGSGREWKRFIAENTNELLSELERSHLRPVASATFYKAGLQNLFGEFEDVESEVMSAVLQRMWRGLKTFNPEKGRGFLDYVKDTAYFGMKEWHRGQDAVPRGLRKRLTDVSRATEELTRRFGEMEVESGLLDPLIEMKAELIDISLEQLREQERFFKPQTIFQNVPDIERARDEEGLTVDRDDPDAYRHLLLLRQSIRGGTGDELDYRMGGNGVLPEIAVARQYSPMDAVHSREFEGHVMSVLRRAGAGEVERKVFWLYEVGGITLKNIGTQIGFTESRACQVKSNLVDRVIEMASGKEPESLLVGAVDFFPDEMLVNYGLGPQMAELVLGTDERIRWLNRREALHPNRRAELGRELLLEVLGKNLNVGRKGELPVVSNMPVSTEVFGEDASRVVFERVGEGFVSHLEKCGEKRDSRVKIAIWQDVPVDVAHHAKLAEEEDVRIVGGLYGALSGVRDGGSLVITRNLAATGKEELVDLLLYLEAFSYQNKLSLELVTDSLDKGLVHCTHAGFILQKERK
ncbi:MAG: sigma-70 family RNA polymerase sigma factor [Bdellovibrionales bacterium]|nr:sigma-70 family RNA polymerase sigma factor [Bdellovibrionales bacterium]